MNILLTIESLACGGAERVISTLANYWDEKGHSVTLCTVDDPPVEPFYPLNSGVTFVRAFEGDFRDAPLSDPLKSQDIFREMRKGCRRSRALRKVIRTTSPDVIISFLKEVNVLTLLASLGLNIPVLVSERLAPDTSLWTGSSPYGIPRPYDVLRRIFYRFATNVIVQTESARNEMLRSIRKKTIVIPNHVAAPPTGNAVKPKERDRKNIVSVGRVVQQKNYPLLITSFASLSTRFSDWDLIIVGGGPLRGEIEKMISDLGLTERVRITGFVKNPAEYLQQADLFVMSSLGEGFPNALLEAMSYGIPAISTNCKYGPSDIISHQQNGLLVPIDDLNAMTGAMSQLMGDLSLRVKLGENATAVVSQFSFDKVMTLWDRAIVDSASYPSQSRSIPG